MHSVRFAMSFSGWNYCLAGLALAALSFSPQGRGALMDVVTGPGGHGGIGEALLMAVGGGLTVGFGAAMLAARRLPVEALIPCLRALAAGLIAWYLVDSAASALHGAWLNVLGNTGFLTVGLLPFAFAKSQRLLDPLAAQDRASPHDA